MTSTPEAVCLELHDLLLAFQKAQRFAALERGVPAENVTRQIGNTEESILFVIDAEPGRSVKELAERLTLERSWVSRVVAALEAKKLVRSVVPPSDRRSKQVRITSRGRDLLLEAEGLWKKIMAHCLEPISPAENETLARRLRALADGFGAHDYLRHSAGDAVGYQLGRLNAACGVLGRSLFGSGLSLTQVQVMHALRELKDAPAQVNAVNRLVPFDLSTVSRVLQGFEDEGLVKKARSAHDRRSFGVELSAEGRARLDRYRALAAGAFEGASKRLTRAEINEMISLLERLGTTLARHRAGAHPEEAAIRALSGEEEARRAAAVLEQRTEAPGSEVRRMGLYRGGELAAVVEVERSRQSGAVRRIAFGGEEIPSAKCLALIKSCLSS